MSTLKINNIQSVTNGSVTFPQGITLGNQPILLGDGSASLPSLSFTNSINAGLYKINQNAIGISTNGTERFRVDENGNFNFDNGALFINGITNQIGINTTNPTSPLDVIGNIKISGIIHSSSGIVTSPSITFTADNDTGFFRQAENSIGFAASGTEIVRINVSGASFINGTATNPSLDFINDPDTGIYRSAENQLSISTGGIERFRIESTGLIKSVYESTLGTDYNTRLDNGYLCRAWVNFDGTSSNLTGTYSRTGNLITVSISTHGLTNGQTVYLDFTTGTGTDGIYVVTLIDGNSYTVVDSVSGSTSGNVTQFRYIRASANISSITDNSTGDYTLNFLNSMPDTNYVVLNTGSNASDGQGAFISHSRSRTATVNSYSILCYNAGFSSLVDQNTVFSAVFR